jgi:hypothetical protein
MEVTMEARKLAHEKEAQDIARLNQAAQEFRHIQQVLAQNPGQPLPACLSMLQKALSNMLEAAAILQTVATPELQGVQSPAKAFEAEALHEGLEAVESLLTTTVENCLKARSFLRNEKHPVSFKNLSDKSRDGAPL